MEKKTLEEKLEEHTLVELAKKGDKLAFGQLIDKYWEVLSVIVYTKVQNYADTEDILQESFLKAYRKLHTLRDNRKFAPWLYGIAATTTIDWLRREKRQAFLPLEEVQEAPYWDSQNLQLDNREALLEVMKRLPEKYHIVIVLRYFKNMSYKEIAEHLGEPEGTISNRLHRANKLLREWLERIQERSWE